jgi:tetratricopeptide (TPR) repeat protein
MSLSSWLDARIESMRHLEECEFEFTSFSEKRSSLTRLVHDTLHQWESRRLENLEQDAKPTTTASSSRSDSDEDVEETTEETARYLADRGRILAFGDKQDISEAHELLTKAVRLNPSIGEAWLSLGRVFIQKKNEVGNARECFQKAVDKERNVVPLRELSRCLRMLGKERLLESLSIAKEAVSKNVKDSESWCMLLVVSIFFLASVILVY